MSTDNIARAMASKSSKIATSEREGLLSAVDKSKLDTLSAPAKNNLSALAMPTNLDDSSKGYTEGSAWVYNGIQYKCINSTLNSAVWSSSADIFFFDTWSQLVTAISVVGTTYVGKFATVANANGGAMSNATYTAPASMGLYIVDGGSATYKINAQGTNYSVTCQARTITNPVVTSVMLIASAKPTVAGYYIFTVAPTNGLPIGISINDIAYFDGVNWSCYQTYAIAMAVLVVGVTTNIQVTWRKFNGTWMSTADAYIPDGKEYQTGKIWNGKPVYRKCTSGTTNSTSGSTYASVTTPAGATVVSCFANIVRTDGFQVTITYFDGVQVFINGTNTLTIWTNTGYANFYNRPYVAWVEYTKS